MMNKSLIFIFLLIFLGFFVLSSVNATTIEVSQPTYLTSNSEYDRNPSIIFDGSDYWLFYTKSDNINVRSGSDVDSDTYVVYYKTASTIEGLSSAAEIKLTLSESGRPANFDQRVVSAVLIGSDIYVFVSSGQTGTDRGLYYYKYNGSWNGPYTLIADATARGGHVNVVSDGVNVYIVWESSDGSSDFYVFYAGTSTLSSKYDISNDNQPKITLMGNNLYVVSIEDSTGDIEVYSSDKLFISWSSHSTAISGAGLYDPCIFNDGIDFYVVTAPYVAADRQYLIQTKYNGTWSSTKQVSYGGYGATEWWDYWPIGYHDGTDAYIFFTTETNSPTYSDGEIAYIKMDWDLFNDHYFYIQNAIDAATGTTINVGPGTYNEKVTIDKDNLVLQSTGGAANTIINPTDTTVGGIYITGNGDTFDGFTVQDSPDLGHAYENKIIRINGDDNIIQNNILQGNLRLTEYGILIYGSGNLVDSNEIYDIGYHGINVVYSDADGNTISNNHIHDMGMRAVAIDRAPNNILTQNTISNLVGGNLCLWETGDCISEYDPATWCWGVIVWGAASTGTTLDNQDLTGLPNGVVLSATQGVTVENSEISNNDVGIKLADSSWISDTSDNNVIQYNDIHDNTDGIVVQDGGFGGIGTGNSINQNKIYDNPSPTTGVHNYASQEVNVESNWWGSADGPSGEGPGTGDAVSTNVDYDPWWANEEMTLEGTEESVTAGNCNDDVDNDYDSLTDCNDPDCYGVTRDCGEGDCQGIHECTESGWGPCSTMAVVCGYIDCPDSCDIVPDDYHFTYDYAPSAEKKCDSDGICQDTDCVYTHTCADDDSDDGIPSEASATCGAECDSDDDCQDKCVGNVYYYNGDCIGDCTCSYDTHDCDLQDDWYDTGNTQWVEDTQCTEKEQKEQEYREYSCDVGGCDYSATGTQWVDTGNTKNKQNGTPCDDGFYCIVGETCLNGVCYNGVEKDCSDGVDCTDDSCDETNNQCVNIPNDAYCDDGLWCNGYETCDAVNDCQPGTPPDCSDANECTDDVCNEDLDQCENPNSAPGTECGSARNCPDDACNVFVAEFYPDDGHDECDGAGNCEVYSCTMEDSFCTDDNPADGVNTLECGAECDQDSDCAATECDQLDGCVGLDYYDYDDVANDCLGDCTCESNACGAPAIYEDDPICNVAPFIEMKWELPDDMLEFADCEGIDLICETYVDKGTCEVNGCTWVVTQVVTPQTVTKCAAVCDYNGWWDIVGVHAIVLRPPHKEAQLCIREAILACEGFETHECINDYIMQNCPVYEDELLVHEDPLGICWLTAEMYDPDFYIKENDGICKMFTGTIDIDRADDVGKYTVFVKAWDKYGTYDFMENKFLYWECDSDDDCDHLDDDCANGVCNLVTHQCEQEFKLDTAVCRPAADICDATEYCDGISEDCPADEYQPVSTSCEADDNLCTIDHCDGEGSCIFLEDVICQSDTECRDYDICDPETGTCLYTDTPLSTSCEADDLFCTVDHCNGLGECVYWKDYDCSDAFGCTVDSCNEATDSCDHVPNDAYCDDEEYCNGAEYCDVNAGCQDGTPVDCSYLDDECNDGVCDEDLDDCVGDSIPYENHVCDTGDYECKDQCTRGQKEYTCQSGECLFYRWKNQLVCNLFECQDGFCSSICSQACGAACDEDSDCTDESCSENYTDWCDNNNKLVDYDSNNIRDTIIVEDSCENACLVDCTCDDCQVDCSAPALNIHCVAGVCGAECGQDSDCDDGNATTLDECSLESCTCIHTPVGCIVDEDCTEGGWYNTSTLGLESEECRDIYREKWEYRDYYCNTTLYECDYNVTEYELRDIVNINNEINGTSCNDRNGCTENDECWGGFCLGDEVDCSHMNSQCIVGVCNSTADYDYECIENTTIREGKTCSDGLHCTVNETCVSGVCADGEPRNCSDDYSCTDDHCNETLYMCVNAPNDGHCSGGEICDPEVYENQPTGCGKLELTLFSPEDDGVYGTRYIDLTASANGKCDKIEYSDNSDYFKGLCVNCYDYDSLKYFGDGNHTLTVRGITDKETDNKTVHFYVDGRKPTIYLTYPEDGAIIQGSTFTVRYTEDNLEEVLLYLKLEGETEYNSTELITCPEGMNKECSIEVNFSEYNGEVSYYFEVSDLASSDTSDPKTITIDNIDPEVEIISPENQTYFERSLDVDIEVNETVETLRYSLNGAAYRTLCGSCDSYNGRMVFTYGTQNLSIKATDYAGNIGKNSVIFEIGTATTITTTTTTTTTTTPTTTTTETTVTTATTTTPTTTTTIPEEELVTICEKSTTACHVSCKSRLCDPEEYEYCKYEWESDCESVERFIEPGDPAPWMACSRSGICVLKGKLRDGVPATTTTTTIPTGCEEICNEQTVSCFLSCGICPEQYDYCEYEWESPCGIETDKLEPGQHIPWLAYCSQTGTCILRGCYGVG